MPSQKGERKEALITRLQLARLNGLFDASIVLYGPGDGTSVDDLLEDIEVSLLSSTEVEAEMRKALTAIIQIADPALNSRAVKAIREIARAALSKEPGQ